MVIKEKNGQDLIDQIIKIGVRSSCNKDELMKFLPNFPKIHGGEAIFLIQNKLLKKQWSNLDLENLIKGLHCIELEYRRVTQYDIGFGSTSPAYHIIQKLDNHKSSERYKKLVQNSKAWIIDRGGNYYIKGH
jgi:hypothetical protein